MNPQDPLADLQPLRPAEALSWWPPAPGWWLLLGLLVAGLSVMAFLLWRRYRRNRYRRVALQQLARITDSHAYHQDPARLLGEVNSLLKAVVLHSYPKSEMASVTGERWLQFLNDGLEQRGSSLRFPESIGPDAYSAAPQVGNSDELVKATRAWLRLHRSRR
ncbi:hypothetical protein CWI75_08615 [Kineobactrum sediminis]|uniref:DUF4381 domain-containing protein n=1 Tax=Kineobactrum sediminis TaxID=1905677 RepID=A0A2N5Y2M0_9GAMM|nr:DUF4381 domain-containing protein [Kineobactrum sediminis]PLW82637.1 hypothetical protein CWI75_08615 [Kineobactrum sediminis]